MKALTILEGYLRASLKIAEDYNSKARFYAQEGDMDGSMTYQRIASEQLMKATEHEEAINELKKLLTLKSA